MSNRTILNVANGTWYPKGQRRMVESVGRHGYAGDFMLFTDSYPRNSPTHQDVPYAFKPYAFRQAFDEGHEHVLWLDCSLIAHKSVDPIFEAIERDGYYAVLDNQMTGEWCSDAAEKSLGIDREEWFDRKSLLIGCFGLKASSDVARDFMKEWLRFADDGISFQGKGSNEFGQVSTDKRVKGHRWEQTAASVIFHRMGLNGVFPPHINMVEGERHHHDSIFTCVRGCA